MNKQTVLIMLATRLDEYGMPENEIIRNIKMYEKYLNSLSPENLNDELSNIEVDVIAENINNFYLKKINKEKKDETLQTQLTVPEISESEIIPLQEKVNTFEPEEKSLIKTNSALPQRKLNISPIEYEQVPLEPEPIDFESLDRIPYDEAPVKGTAAFWVIFISTLPITIPIIIAVFAIFFAVIAAISVLIAGLVAALIGIVAGGSALTLVGVIYGITQTFSALPIGLYEIGLGVIIGGASMLTGILIYNFAVRLLPFAIKHVIRFMKFTVTKIGELFYYLKKESAKK